MTKLAVLSDIHYYSPLLGVSGRAYELRSGSDQKCLAESGAVTDETFKRLINSDVNAVLIAGDITNDGEKSSHDGIFEKLCFLNEKKPVYLITSTHDWCSDGNARRYEGENTCRDVETVSKEELNGIYAVFGEKRVIASYKTNTGFYSRVYQVSPSLRLIAVNDDGDGANGASGYSDAHMAWMKEQLRDAKSAGVDVIAMEHHLVLHGINGLVNGSQSIADKEKRAAELADAGLRLIITGHSHMLRTTEFISPAGNRLTQLNAGSLCGYPAPITYITVENGSAHIKTEFLDGFTYNGKKYDGEFFREHTAGVIIRLLHAAATDKKELSGRLAADGIRIKQLDRLYPLIRLASRKAQRVSVGSAGKFINSLTFGKGIDKKALNAVKDEKLLKTVTDVFLCVFDGSHTACSMSKELKTVVTQVSALPGKAVSRLPLNKEKKEKIYKITDAVKATAQELMYPSPPDNLECEISLC